MIWWTATLIAFKHKVASSAIFISLGGIVLLLKIIANDMKKPITRLTSFSHTKTLLGLLAIGVFVVTGIVVLSLSKAATPFVTSEPESGTASAGAVALSDAAASGSRAVRFSTATPSPTPSPSPTPTPTPTPGTHRFPYSFNDSQFFANVTTVAPFQIGCQTRTDLSVITYTEPAAIVNSCGSGTSTINHVRLGGDLAANGNVREGYRCAGTGTMNVQNSWLEAKGSGDDHADVLQCYDPNNSPTATLNVSNTTIRGYNTAATAGLFVADAYSVDVHLDNVLFWGGPFGLRIHTDGRPGKLYANNVCFYGNSASDHSFGTGPILINPYPPTIVEWNNVNWCTIENGTLVTHGAIAKP